MSMRVYVLVAFFFGAMLFAISTFLDAEILNWIRGQQAQATAVGQRAIGVIITEPVIFVIGERPLGPIIGGLLWPLVIVWIVLIPLLLVVIAGMRVLADLDEQLWDFRHDGGYVLAALAGLGLRFRRRLNEIRVADVETGVRKIEAND